MSENEFDDSIEMDEEMLRRFNSQNLFYTCLGMTLVNLGAVDGAKTAPAFLLELAGTIARGIKETPAGSYDLDSLSTMQVLLEGAVIDAGRHLRRMIGGRYGELLELRAMGPARRVDNRGGFRVGGRPITHHAENH